MNLWPYLSIYQDQRLVLMYPIPNPKTSAISTNITTTVKCQPGQMFSYIYVLQSFLMAHGIFLAVPYVHFKSI